MKLFNSEPSFAEQIPKAELEHVLVMQLGDTSAVVMLSPALRALREALPQAEVTLFTSAAGGQLAPLLPWVDHVMVDQSTGQEGAGSRAINPKEEIILIERLRQCNFSIALIFSSVAQSTTRAAFACYLAGIPYRVGFGKGMASSILSHSLPPLPDDLHEVDRNLYLLNTIGISEGNPQLELNVPGNVENRANELLGLAGLKLSIPYTVIAPGEIGLPGQRRSDPFAAVARILAAQTEQQVVVVGTSAEAPAIQPILQVAHENLYGNVYSLVGKTTLPELAAIVQQASLTIANRSISIQFADVFRCPLVILHAETDMVSQWIPRNTTVRLLSRPAACANCNHVDCSKGINCLDVRPEEIAIAALEMLSKPTQGESDYKGIFRYQINLERNDPSSTR